MVAGRLADRLSRRWPIAEDGAAWRWPLPRRRGRTADAAGAWPADVGAGLQSDRGRGAVSIFRALPRGSQPAAGVRVRHALMVGVAAVPAAQRRQPSEHRAGVVA